MESEMNNIRVHRSDKRKKSCGRCVKAKRRCDLTLPACGRCKIRGEKCVYDNFVSSATVPSPRKATHLKVIEPNAHVPPITDLSTWDTSSETFSISPPRVWINSPTNIQLDGPLTPYDSFPFPELGILAPHQITYCTTQLTNCISSFVHDNHNLFIHPASHNSYLSPAYIDALSVCSLYIQRTPQNLQLVFRILDTKLADLVIQSKTWISIEGSLLGVQALILYQIIRILDGDIRQRAHANRHFELLDSWTIDLHKRYGELAPLPKNHSSWVLMESVRRTIMVSVMLRDLNAAQESGVCELVSLMTTLPVSQDGRLWTEKTTSGEEEMVKGEVMSYREYTNAWNEGIVTDVEVEDYEKMLLVLCWHAKRTKHFLNQT